MRILQVVPTYLPATRYGGPIYSVHGLSRGLVELGHEVHVFTTNVDGPGVSKVPVGQPVGIDGVAVWYFPVVHPRRIYRAPALGRALQRMLSQFDIVHLHSVFLWPTWAAAAACRKAGVPYFLAPRGMMVKELIQRRSRLAKTVWIRLIERFNLECAAAIHVTAEIEASELRKFGLSLPIIVTIPNGVALPPKMANQAVRPDIFNLCQQRPLILYLGRINWKKNLIELVRAMCDVRSGHLGIVGNDEDGYGEIVSRAASTLGVASRVTVLPRPIVGHEKEAILSACDLFVLPSLSENFGNAALEAAIRGKPIVISENAGMASFARDYQCGLICQPSAEGLSHSIAEILNDLEHARLMGERGRVAATRDYSWSAIASRMSTAYEAAIRNWPQRMSGNSERCFTPMITSNRSGA